MTARGRVGGRVFSLRRSLQALLRGLLLLLGEASLGQLDNTPRSAGPGKDSVIMQTSAAVIQFHAFSNFVDVFRYQES